jgi:hypothetical protein
MRWVDGLIAVLPKSQFVLAVAFGLTGAGGSGSGVKSH